jgi:hypothetical protein
MNDAFLTLSATKASFIAFTCSAGGQYDDATYVWGPDVIAGAAAWQ